MASLSDKRTNLAAGIDFIGQKYNLPKAKVPFTQGDLSDWIRPGSAASAQSTRPVTNNTRNLWETNKVDEDATRNLLQGLLDKKRQPSRDSGGSNKADFSGKYENSDLERRERDYYDELSELEKELMSEAYKDADREYRRNREELEAQRGYAETQKGRSLSNLQGALEAVRGTVGRSREEAQQGYETDVRAASDDARSVERKNRNTLRALGILGSSAAGELLSKPWQQFDQQKAQLREGVRQRFVQLDDFLVQKTQEHANMVAELEDNFSNLVSQINRDLSFNAEERLAAKTQANQAYRQRLAEIKGAQLQWERAVDTNKQNLINEAMSMGQNTDLLSTYDPTGIAGSQFTPTQTGTPTQVGIKEEDDETALLPYQLQDQRTNPLLSMA